MIDVKIPYTLNGNLGKEQNRIISQSQNRWVLSVDHDVLLAVNPHWYYLCVKAINKYATQNKIGIFTCYTNDIGDGVNPHEQRYASGVLGDDVYEHVGAAKYVFATNQYQCTDITHTEKFAQFFMLVNKEAWQKAGGFKDGFFDSDRKFAKRIKRAGYKIYRIDGLYVYHMHNVNCKSWIDGQKTRGERWENHTERRKNAKT